MAAKQHEMTIDQYNTLQKLCAKNWRGPQNQLEDYTGDVIADVLTHWAKYDPSKGSFSTWAWYRTMKIRDRYTRRAAIKPLSNTQYVENWDILDEMYMGQEVVESKAEMSLLMERAPLIVQEALMAQALGLSSSETREALGVSGQSKQQRIKRHIKRLEKGNK